MSTIKGSFYVVMTTIPLQLCTVSVALSRCQDFNGASIYDIIPSSPGCPPPTQASVSGKGASGPSKVPTHF